VKLLVLARTLIPLFRCGGSRRRGLRLHHDADAC
jgi:hypothetical protein